MEKTSAIPSLKRSQGIQCRKIAIDDYPVWGTPQEVLKYHRVDGESLVESIYKGVLKS